MIDYFIFFLALAISYWIFVGRKHPPGFPPSPSFSLPVIGDALTLGQHLPVGFKKLRHKYFYKYVQRI